ncbi:MAG: ferredoxin [Gammaproteobacteria bacterium TMED119]|nr:MAG: ferredoxin [Gammaproteobacteria bacterium TMED119]RCL46804.1 MAG: 4Fe-4S dicluster domain-containing protein [Candidatus Thioglobus sp.]
MVLTITEECINCDACVPRCPNDAIYFAAEHYQIDSQLCTQCVGHFEQPQCIAICPVVCIYSETENCL